MKHFHGRGRHRTFFEGWYFRHQNGRETLAVIPAYHVDQKGWASASIQVITNSAAWSIPYPASLFHANEACLGVRIGKNRFSASGISLDLSGPGLALRGELRYGPFSPPAGDIMGPFRFLPGMECRHGVLSLGHRVEGSVLLNGRKLDFSGGTGYLEKDWGSSFPQTYLWSQCNRFGPVPCSIFLSAASIPLPGGPSFTGCIASVLLRGREYRLATYCGARVLALGPKGAVLRQGSMILRADLLEAQARPLLAPAAGGMTRTIHESAACRVRYRFRCENRLLLDLTSRQAGFEWAEEKS